MAGFEIVKVAPTGSLKNRSIFLPAFQLLYDDFFYAIGFSYGTELLIDVNRTYGESKN